MKTIGDRVKLAAKEVGGLNALAKIIDMPRRTLGDQISGKFEVKLSFMIDVAKATGFSLEWLATGIGPTKISKETIETKINPQLFESLARVVSRIHRDANIKLQAERLTAETAVIYNELAARVANMDDREEIEATLPQLEYALKKRLKDAVAEPGTGKREAS